MGVSRVAHWKNHELDVNVYECDVQVLVSVNVSCVSRSIHLHVQVSILEIVCQLSIIGRTEHAAKRTLQDHSTYSTVLEMSCNYGPISIQSTDLKIS